MKRCDKKVENKPNKPNEFPEVVLGDTVARLCSGQVYMVGGGDHGQYLVNLETGTPWSNNSLWGTSSPDGWKKVTCCYTVEDE